MRLLMLWHRLERQMGLINQMSSISGIMINTTDIHDYVISQDIHVISTGGL